MDYAKDYEKWKTQRILELEEALKPFATIHKSLWDRQNIMTGEGSVQRAVYAYVHCGDLKRQELRRVELDIPTGSEPESK